ncbi:hypothetical protein LCGC14_0337990 [marine sediment metagenome]|uniref:Uncharacterized protein n=1 Tax=marine sediment metagenome TaxID=412755 RepID=A0A0F9TEF1_9ZZZZ
MPITRIPPTGQREIEFATGNLFKGLNLARQFQALSLQEEQAKVEAVQRELENRIRLAQESRAATTFQGQEAALSEIARRREPAPPGQLIPPSLGPPSTESLLTLPELRAKAGIGAKVPAKEVKRLTPIQKIEQGRLLLDTEGGRGAGVSLLNQGLAAAGSTYRVPKNSPTQVVTGMADLMIGYNAATKDIDFNLPANAAKLDTIESGLLENLTKSEAFQRATPDNKTKMANAAGKFFEAKRKMRQKSRTVRETILDKVTRGIPLTTSEQKVYDEAIKRKDPLTPEEVGERTEARTLARLKSYRQERQKAIATNNLDDLRSLITDAEEKLLGRADPEEVERLMWGTLEAHYRTKRKPKISPDEFEKRGEELETNYGYNEETIVRLLRLQFKVTQ